jgi:glucan biosynthesis protein
VYRVAFELDPNNERVVEMGVVLRSQGKPWGEMWLYQWSR